MGKFSLPDADSSASGNTYAESPAHFPFRIFAALWAVATLFHMAHSSLFNTQLNFALLTLTALYVVIRPRVPGFLLLLVLQIFDALYRMPFASNHWVFTALVNVTILQSSLYLAVINRSFSISEESIFRTFSPLVRMEVIILYFFAVFHKLNFGFFAPLTSCAFDLLKAQHLDAFIPFSDQFYKWNPYFTVIAELAIPVMLCINRTRHAGIVFGMFFHGVLAFSTYNAFYDFSSMIFAAYFLFADTKLSDAIVAISSSVRSNIREWFRTLNLLKVGVVFVCVMVLLGLMAAFNQTIDTPRTVHLVLWGCYCCVAILIFLLGWLIIRKQPTQLSFSALHWSLLLLPVLVFVNGTSPYLGLKTENSYAMFSNLRTEGGQTNHFIVPASIQVFDFQKDIVEIVSSTDAGLQDLAIEKKAIVLFEFKNFIQKRKPQRVDYLLNGTPQTYLQSDRSTHAMVKPNPFILTRLMRFRSFHTKEPQPCSH
jgi:hypothetical protein